MTPPPGLPDPVSDRFHAQYAADCAVEDGLPPLTLDDVLPELPDEVPSWHAFMASVTDDPVYPIPSLMRWEHPADGCADLVLIRELDEDEYAAWCESGFDE